MLKIDLAKAYAPLIGNSSLEFLTACSYQQLLTKRVQMCITFTLHINGERLSFKGGKGLSEDPMSSLLFVMAIDYFSRLRGRDIKLVPFDYHPKCRQMKLTQCVVLVILSFSVQPRKKLFLRFSGCL